MISTSSNKIDEIVAPDEIETYVSMPSCLLQGCSNDLIIFRADGGNHFTHYGIYEGMFLIFDVSKDFKDGHLSCYLNNSGDDRRFRIFSQAKPRGHAYTEYSMEGQSVSTVVSKLEVHSWKEGRLPLLPSILLLCELPHLCIRGASPMFSGAICSGGADFQTGSQCQHATSSGF